MVFYFFRVLVNYKKRESLFSTLPSIFNSILSILSIMLKLLIILSACFSLSLAFWAPNDARLLDDGEAVPKAWVRDAGSEEEQEQEAQQLFTEEEMQEVNETLATFNSGQ